jgi:multidrug efflux pump subunit AcrB
MEENKYGYAGKIAKAFINSKLTPILILSAILTGVFATINLPREEEPQINVPMVDIFVPYYGATPPEIEKNIINTGERKLWEIDGVEYVYSMAYPNMGMFVLRFKVGTDPDLAITRTYSKVFSNKELFPKGAGEPLIKLKTIDDVPIMALTLWSEKHNDYDLRRVAASIQQELNSVDNVSETTIIGGHKRQFIVHFDPKKMAEKRITPYMLAGIIKMSNSKLPAGHINNGDKKIIIETDSFIKNVEELKNTIVGVSNGNVVKLSDIADVIDGPDEEERVVLMKDKNDSKDYASAVTIAISKKRGTNATKIANEIIEKISKIKGSVIPTGVNVAVTRNYGETAKEKSDELIYHMLLATVSVTLLILFTLGWKESIVVLVAIPVTLALTLLVYYLYGYTLNRITLFALIFSIGILVDDAIVVIENINRHCLGKKKEDIDQHVVNAVDEVGNPTILATFTVIASILPMAFVRGMMGPYMRPIPVGASVAMLFSLGVAFIVTPWFFSRMVRKFHIQHCEVIKEGFWDGLYRKFLDFLLKTKLNSILFLILNLVLLIAAVSIIFFRGVIFKTLPFDNKSEFQIVINMPEDSSINKTTQVAKEIADYVSKVDEVKDIQIYNGTSAPFNFNGLVRHYYLRNMPYQADIQVNLTPKQERKRQSHEIATSIRKGVKEIADKYKARVQIAEVPPGPPVLATMVIEVYDKNYENQKKIADDIKNLLLKKDFIVDVDSYLTDPQPKFPLIVNRQRATLNGISSSEIAQTISMAIYGYPIDIAHMYSENEPVDINIRLSKEKRNNLEFLKDIHLFSPSGMPVVLDSLVKKANTVEDDTIQHKNLKRVIYVTGDVSGSEESPIYAILNLQKDIKEYQDRTGVKIKQYFTTQPRLSSETAIKWDGEWHITYEVFRDLGIAFGVVMILIYILVVAWFENFITPLIIMSAIPLALIGIIPAHWAMKAFFTATSMIGFIASSGIVVRNSIILVDFIELKVSQGVPFKRAVIDAGVIRFRPMLLTALAVIIGAGVILLDPIFQGLAISLISGQVASTLLSRVAVPVLYYITFKNKYTKHNGKGEVENKNDEYYEE